MLGFIRLADGLDLRRRPCVRVLNEQHYKRPAVGGMTTSWLKVIILDVQLHSM